MENFDSILVGYGLFYRVIRVLLLCVSLRGIMILREKHRQNLKTRDPKNTLINTMGSTSLKTLTIATTSVE